MGAPCAAIPAPAQEATGAPAAPAAAAPKATPAPPASPRYELLFSPTLEAESGARLVSSAVTATASGEERLFAGLGPGAGGIAARSARFWFWDLPVGWWFGVVQHEAFGHGGRGREFRTAPSVHLGSPWGGRDSYATFDLTGTSSEERLYIYAGGTESNTLTATLLERRAVEGVRLRPLELMNLVAGRLVAADYVLRTTPDPGDEPGAFYDEFAGGGDVANYLGYLHEMHAAGGGNGVTPAGSDEFIDREYGRLRRQATWTLFDPGLWWALASALRLTVRGDATAPVPLPRTGSFRWLPVLSSEWTPAGGEVSLELLMAPANPTLTRGAGAGSRSGPGLVPGPPSRPPRTFSFVARHGNGPLGAFGALGTSAEDLVRTGRIAFGGAAETWYEPRGGLGGGARLRWRLRRGRLRGLYFDTGVKSQGYWIGQPATAGPYGAVGILWGTT